LIHWNNYLLKNFMEKATMVTICAIAAACHKQTTNIMEI